MENAMSLRSLATLVVATSALAALPAQAGGPDPKDAQVVELTVTSKGFEPSLVTVKNGKPVTVVVTPKGPGPYRFACGMNMIAGTLKVQ
jgi:plastocyanin domain-containing protein